MHLLLTRTNLYRPHSSTTLQFTALQIQLLIFSHSIKESSKHPKQHSNVDLPKTRYNISTCMEKPLKSPRTNQYSRGYLSDSRCLGFYFNKHNVYCTPARPLPTLGFSGSVNFFPLMGMKSITPKTRGYTGYRYNSLNSNREWDIELITS